jgi:hypothetical protein
MTHHDQDVIEVRPDECLDEDQLSVYLAGKLPGAKVNYESASSAVELPI